jgi:hypothetical protein
MANEVTIPLLPCADIDEIATFYEVLGFERTYRQVKPNPYVALRREDLHLHFFGMPEFDPAASYGTCVVLVDDIEALHRAFADGMRAAYGKVLVSGRPRMTRPRARRNNDGRTGFSLVDPGGNWIRITATSAPAEERPSSRLAQAMDNAVVLGDSKGDPRQALKILDGAIGRAGPGEDPEVLAAALDYRAELTRILTDDGS